MTLIRRSLVPGTSDHLLSIIGSSTLNLAKFNQQFLMKPPRRDIFILLVSLLTESLTYVLWGICNIALFSPQSRAKHKRKNNIYAAFLFSIFFQMICTLINLLSFCPNHHWAAKWWCKKNKQWPDPLPKCFFVQRIKFPLYLGLENWI